MLHNNTNFYTHTHILLSFFLSLLIIYVYFLFYLLLLESTARWFSTRSVQNLNYLHQLNHFCPEINKPIQCAPRCNSIVLCKYKFILSHCGRCVQDNTGACTTNHVLIDLIRVPEVQDEITLCKKNLQSHDKNTFTIKIGGLCFSFGYPFYWFFFPLLTIFQMNNKHNFFTKINGKFFHSYSVCQDIVQEQLEKITQTMIYSPCTGRNSGCKIRNQPGNETVSKLK